MFPIRYYVFHGKREYGPFEKSELRELVAAGVLTINELMRAEGTEKYKPIAKFDLSETFVSNNSSIAISYPYSDSNIINLQSANTADFYGCAKSEQASTAEIEMKGPGIEKLGRFLPVQWLQKALAGRAFIAFLQKASQWLILVAASMFLQYFLFSKYFSKVFEVFFPTPEPTGISFTGQVVEMVIVFCLSTYIIAMVAMITIDGASRLYQRKDFIFKEVFATLQCKLVSFLIIICGFSCVIIPLYIATVIFPELLEPCGKYFALTIFLLITYRLVLLPFCLIGENMSLWMSFRFCINLSYGQFKPIVRFGLLVIAILIIQDIATRFYQPFSMIKQLINLYLLILATFFYKDLVRKRHYKL